MSLLNVEIILEIMLFDDNADDDDADDDDYSK
jgi:hypothetical protein